jgi:hypothetical protein
MMSQVQNACGLMTQTTGAVALFLGSCRPCFQCLITALLLAAPLGK